MRDALLRKMNKRVQELRPSSILQFNQEISKIPDIVKLTIGEPDFNTPEHIKKAAIESIESNDSHYTDPRGTLGLRQAASKYLNKKYGLKYDSETQLIITAGAGGGIYAALSAILNQGDKVIIPTPIFPLYFPITLLNGATPILIDTSDDGFVLSESKLKHALDYYGDEVKAIIFNFPTNPTGVTYKKDNLVRLAKVISNYDVFVVSDEIYSELSYSQPHVSFGTILPEQTIVINGVSKSHAMTGWRIGIVGGPAEVVKEISKVNEFSVTCCTANAQAAAEEALGNGLDDSIRMKDEYQARRKLIVNGLHNLGFEITTPDGAFYIFAKIPANISTDSETFSRELAYEAGVAVIPGAFFGEGGENYIRISYATSEVELKKGLERIQLFLERKEGFE